MSTPSVPLQSVVAFCLWHEGDLYDNWSAAGLATSDNAELQAIADGICQAYNVGLEDLCQVHVFSDSTNALRLTMDVSHHLGQNCPYPFPKCWCPWLQHHPNNSVHFHHITAGVDLEDHQLAHILATSTHVEAGSMPVISANLARCGAVTWMLEGWNSLFQSKKYIKSNFLTLYQRKDTPLIPTHVKSGLWMCKVGHSHSLTACLVHCTTGHAPIGAFHSRFFPEESTACRCSFPMDTVSHILYRCLSHERELDPKEQLRYLWLLKFLEANESAFVFDIP
jgi:ribonuclease HI